ncbi:hypothetical protein B296_00019145 [Ensete ventricosum]|uniref:Uncharacterized protein n=1 Tax=Ensete ventricosum TaxID=4639 RepID=A0A426Y5Y7_ENSVE|nr:hypothetical protein B296_00019145 [Ensete ventricosum]
MFNLLGIPDKIQNKVMFLFLRAYRAFYILNWIYRFVTEDHYSAWICKIVLYILYPLHKQNFHFSNPLLSCSLDRWSGKTTQSFDSRLKLNVKTKCRLQDRKYLRWED